MARRLLRIVIVSLCLCVEVNGAGPQTSFRRVNGRITDIADDLTIISTSPGMYGSNAYLFPPIGRSERLEAQSNWARAVSLSADGTVIAGHSVPADGEYYRAWQIGADGQRIELGTLGGSHSDVRDMSEDGRVVVGSSNDSAGLLKIFTWTATTGMVAINTPDNTSPSAVGVSADGSTVLAGMTVSCPECYTGDIIVDCSGECGPIVATYEAGALFKEGQEPIYIEGLDAEQKFASNGQPYVPQSVYPTAISEDGRKVIGTIVGPNEGFIWSQETGTQPLDRFNNWSFNPLDLSADGSIVVGGTGGSCGTDCYAGVGAVVWDDLHGTRLLKDVLVNEFGLADQIGSLFLESATYVSDDGTILAGRRGGTAGGGSWLVQLPYSIQGIPEPASLLLVIVGSLSGLGIRRRG